MLRTVVECDKALELLEMEREHILRVRKFLEENGPQLFIARRQRGLRNEVLQIVADNPGIDGRSVREILDKNEVFNQGRQVQSCLSNLAIAGEIENRGKHGLGAQWYIKEN